MSMRGKTSLYVMFNRFIESLKPKNLKQKGKHMGKDYLGNNYYEIEPDPSRGKRTAVRWFTPPTDDHWDRPLPPEWNAWLRLRRTVPPTDQEMEYNLSLELKKKDHNKQIESETNQHKKHEFSSFPIHREYEETPGEGKHK